MRSSSKPSTARSLNLAMNISLAVGILMLAAKWVAYLLTGSSVIFSDAAESVVHVIAVWFAWYAVRLAAQPPDKEHHYGHEKIGFVSAATEGALICIAAIVIIVSAVEQLFVGVEIHQIGIGTAITAGAGVVNLVLGQYLIRTGRQHRSLTVEANGKHVMTDVWTSLGAVAGLLIAWWTGILELDPIIAILFAGNILREGVGLVYTSVQGLMDRTDPELERQATEALDVFVTDRGLAYHRFRLRMAGNVPHVDFHLQFPDSMTVKTAHDMATEAEWLVKEILVSEHTEVITHLEPMTHPKGHE